MMILPINPHCDANLWARKVFLEAELYCFPTCDKSTSPEEQPLQLWSRFGHESQTVVVYSRAVREIKVKEGEGWGFLGKGGVMDQLGDGIDC